MKQIIWKYILFFRKEVGYFLFLACVATIVSVPIPFIYKALIDKVSAGSPSNVWKLMFLYATLSVAHLALNYLKDRKHYTFDYTVSSKVNEDVFRKVLSLPYPILSKKDPGEWMKLVSLDSNDLYHLLTFGVFNLISIVIQLFANCAILFFLYGWYVLLAFLTFPVYYLLIRKGVKNVNLYETKLDETREEWYGDVYSPLNKLKEIKSRRIENFLTRKLGESYANVKKAGTASAIASNFLSHLFSFFESSVTLVVLFTGILLVFSNKLTLGTLFATIYLMGSILSLFNSLSLTITNDIQSRLPGARRVVELFNIEIPQTGGIPDTSNGVKIIFRDVEFSYSSNSNFVLRIPYLELESGKRYVLIGKTGGGKTTFFDLVTGVQFPQSGSITINSVDTREIKEEWWKENVCVLLQDSSIFRGSIRDNILLGEKDESSRLELIISQFNFERIFERFKDGVDANPREGLVLSGGEKRVINILRALFTPNAPMVLIDEGTAGLDPILKANYHKALAEATKNRLSIVITHNMEEIADFDEVLFVHDGTVTKDTHEHLMKVNELYREFVLHGEEKHDNAHQRPNIRRR
jgi:ABC-type bacteriocin/lantibiotic exporter with double-glycine peptidase domain